MITFGNYCDAIDHDSGLRLALVQLAVGVDKPTNLQRVGSFIREAAGKGAKVIPLPVSLASSNSHA